MMPARWCSRLCPAAQQTLTKSPVLTEILEEGPQLAVSGLPAVQGVQEWDEGAWKEAWCRSEVERGPPPFNNLADPPAVSGSNQANAVSRLLQTCSEVMTGPQLVILTN